jgi:AraC-like DNA-binding protein
MNTSPFSLPFIRWANVAVLTSSASVAHRRLYDHELVYVMAGHGEIVIEKVAHEARPERLFFIQPRVWHSFRPDSGSTLHLLGAHFDWTPQHDTLAFPIFSPASEPVEESKFREPREIPGWNLDTLPYLDLQGMPEIRHSLEAIVEEFNHSDEEAREVAGALLAAAIFRIQRAARELQQREQSTLLGADALRRLDRARALLEASPEQPLSIEEVAACVGWSGDHLRRVFRQTLGLSPIQIQTAARLQVARDLLRHENLPIAEVGQRVGFGDASHFARAFKADTGLTPRQYSRLSKRN